MSPCRVQSTVKALPYTITTLQIFKVKKKKGKYSMLFPGFTINKKAWTISNGSRGT